MTCINTPKADFCESWGGIYLLHKETEGQHFWLGIEWHKPCSLRFAFAPALYDKDQVKGAKADSFDWWPYVEFELPDEFFDKGKSRRSQLDDIQKFLDDTLAELDKAKQY